MSDTSETTRSNFASRLLNKELTDRKKTTMQMQKLSPADAARFAAEQGAEQVQEKLGAVRK